MTVTNTIRSVVEHERDVVKAGGSADEGGGPRPGGRWASWRPLIGPVVGLVALVVLLSGAALFLSRSDEPDSVTAPAALEPVESQPTIRGLLARQSPALLR